MQPGSNEPAKDIIAISWQSKGQPERATAYYHKSCYDACPVILPDGEKRELSKEEVAPYATCSSCGWYLKF